MEGAKCPYCQAAYKEEDGKCAECKAIFPWVIEAKEVREDIKSREVNRGRATFTLIDEVFKQAKGGKPVSVAALKGFAFAWLFPRTMIVVGSIITGVVLIAQTVIIYRQNELIEGQNDLMQKQTAAAQLEQVEKLRERIAVTQELADALFQKGSSFQTTGYLVSMSHEWLRDVVPRLDEHYDPRHVITLLNVNHKEIRDAFRVLIDVADRIGPTKNPYSTDIGNMSAVQVVNRARTHCAISADTANQAAAMLNVFGMFGVERGRKADFSSTRSLSFATNVVIRFTEAYAKEADVTSRFEQRIDQMAKAANNSLMTAHKKCNERAEADRVTVAQLEQQFNAQLPAAGVTSPASASAPSAAASR